MKTINEIQEQIRALQAELKQQARYFDTNDFTEAVIAFLEESEKNTSNTDASINLLLEYCFKDSKKHDTSIASFKVSILQLINFAQSKVNSLIKDKILKILNLKNKEYIQNSNALDNFIKGAEYLEIPIDVYIKALAMKHYVWLMENNAFELQYEEHLIDFINYMIILYIARDKF